MAVAHGLAIQLIHAQNPDDRKAEQMIHPDLHWSFPVKGASTISDDFIGEFRDWHLKQPLGALDQWALRLEGQSGKFNINVKEIQSIQHKLSLKSFEEGPKVLIIYGAEYLGAEGNRLLKLLEEPPDETFIILCTERIQGILPTILSRCQHFKLHPIREEMLMSWLKEKGVTDEAKAKELIDLCEGNMGELEELLQHDDRKSALNPDVWLNAIRSSNFEEMLLIANDFRALEKEQQHVFIKTALANLRRHSLHNVDQRIFGGETSDLFDLDVVDKISDTLNEMLEHSERNAHASIMMMSNSIKLWRKLKSK